MALKELVAALLLTTTPILAQQTTPEITLTRQIEQVKPCFKGTEERAIDHIYNNVDFDINKERAFIYGHDDQALYEVTGETGLTHLGQLTVEIDQKKFEQIMRTNNSISNYHTHPAEPIKAQMYREKAENSEHAKIIERMLQCKSLPSKEDIDGMQGWINLTHIVHPDAKVRFGVISQSNIVHFALSQEYWDKTILSQEVNDGTIDLHNMQEVSRAIFDIHHTKRAFVQNYINTIIEGIKAGPNNDLFLPHMCEKISNEYMQFIVKPR